MKAALVPSLVVLSLAPACSHPEDRRWKELLPPSEATLARSQEPTIRVYSIPTPAAAPGKTRLRDLSDHGQQALIEALAKTTNDPAALRKLLATPLEDTEAGGAVNRTRLDRTLIISVSKSLDSLPGDRLMKTIVRIKPRRSSSGEAVFEFAGYTIAKTDTQIQNIANLETTTQAKLSASAAPEIGGFGDNSIGGELSRSHKTSAAITQQYENLGIDIVPEELVVRRESERGLDVIGNTIVALTLAPPPRTDQAIAFLAGPVKMFDKGKALAAANAEFDVRPMAYLAACPLEADVELHYQMRRIIEGREHYTEGKQRVAILRGSLRPQKFQLVRADEAQRPFYQIMVAAEGNEKAITAHTIDGSSKRLLLDDYENARRLAYWLQRGGGSRPGAAAVQLRMGADPWPKGARFHARPYIFACLPEDDDSLPE
jgi:hypothetical protein